MGHMHVILIVETIVAKTTKNFGLMSMKECSHIKTKAELKGSKPMWDENWGIRRSERIFLNDPGPVSPTDTTSGKELPTVASKLPPSKLPVSLNFIATFKNITVITLAYVTVHTFMDDRGPYPCCAHRIFSKEFWVFPSCPLQCKMGKNNCTSMST